MVTADFPGTLDQYLATVEREQLYLALFEHRFNLARAARQLGLTYRAMRYRSAVQGLIERSAGSAPTIRNRAKDLGKHWPKLRMDALRKYGNACQCCGSGPAQGAVLHIDHIKPRHLFPHLEFNLDNLQVLCSVCHESKGLNDTDWRAPSQTPSRA
jgi:hypothetical protein